MLGPEETESSRSDLGRYIGLGFQAFLPLYWNWLGLISFVEGRLVGRKMLTWNPERNLDLLF